MMRGRVAAAALLLAVWTTAGGHAQAASPSAVPWKSVRLQAEKLTGRITAEVRIEPEAAEPLPPGLWPAVKSDPLRPSGKSVLRLTVAAVIDPLGVASLRMENRLWFDPLSRSPLRLFRSRLGMDEYAQWFVFGRDQVFRRQLEPANTGQLALPPESWTRGGETVYDFQNEICPFSIETSMLIYTLSEAVAKGVLDLPPRCVFHKRQLHQLSFKVQRREQVAYDYLELGEGGPQRRKGAAAAVRIRISSAPIGSFHGSVEPWFKDAYLTISADGRLPLEVACDFPVIGHVELHLDQIRF